MCTICKSNSAYTQRNYIVEYTGSTRSMCLRSIMYGHVIVMKCRICLNALAFATSAVPARPIARASNSVSPRRKHRRRFTSSRTHNYTCSVHMSVQIHSHTQSIRVRALELAVISSSINSINTHRNAQIARKHTRVKFMNSDIGNVYMIVVLSLPLTICAGRPVEHLLTTTDGVMSCKS